MRELTWRMLGKPGMALMLLAGSSWAAPGLLNYQGRLTSNTGDPVTSAVNVTFTFYDAATDGNQLGGFVDTDEVIPNSDGVFSTLIGDDPDNLVPDSIFTADAVWLNVNYGGEDIVPRKRVTSTGYAFSGERVKQTVRNFVVEEGQSVTAGSIVAMLNNGKVLAGSGVPWGSAAIFNNDNTTDIAAAVLSPTRFVLAYKDAGSSWHSVAVIGDINGTDITFGPEAVFYSANAEKISIAGLAADKCVVVYLDSGNVPRARVGTASGNTLSFGTPVQYNDHPVDYVNALGLSSTQCVIAFRDLNMPDAQGQAVVGTLSGETSITFGSKATFLSGHDVEPDVLSLAKLSDSTCILAYLHNYTDPPYTTSGGAVVGEISGSAITFGAESTFSPSNPQPVSVAALSDSQCVIAYGDPNSANAGKVVAGTVSGTNLTFGSPQTFAPLMGEHVRAVALSSTQAAIVYQDTSYNGLCTAADVSGTALTFGPTSTFDGGVSVSICAAQLSAGQIVIIYGDSNYPSNYGIARIANSSPLSQTAVAVGVAGANASTGDTVPVVLEGISGYQSGLTTGQAYYANPDGSLNGTSATAVKAGRALSPTELLLSLEH